MQTHPARAEGFSLAATTGAIQAGSGIKREPIRNPALED
jgi:hypothetical protein